MSGCEGGGAPKERNLLGFKPERKLEIIINY